jgi:GNAT superfamily N-acetyltransferase
MEIKQLDAEESNNIKTLTEAAFAASGDADVGAWFSFDEMNRNISLKRGCCLAAVKGENIYAAIYAEAERPINGPEGREKWVINLMAVHPDRAGQGIGSALIAALESLLREKGIKKLFVFANETDLQVQHFYQKNGYQPAGRIQDYQYGENNSAVFLLKYL